MLPSQRLNEIRRLRLDVANRERRHMPRDRQRHQLTQLMTRQLRHEMLRERLELIGSGIVFLIFATTVILVIP